MNISSRPTPLRRTASRILGGVCGGIAERFGISPVFVRLGAVVAGVSSSGLAVVVYVVAWVLIPPAGADTTAPDHLADADTPALPVAPPPAPVDAREAWYAVGDQLQALVGELRRPARNVGAVPHRPRGPIASLDRAATDAGDRLRRPEVRAASPRRSGGATAETAGPPRDGRRVPAKEW